MRPIIEKISTFTVKPSAFLCDKKIHDQVVDPLPNRHFFMAIIGSAGRGKTSMLVYILSSKQASEPQGLSSRPRRYAITQRGKFEA
jgi:ABC-type transporter Mla maintaining outer membrane lipid asymmetry ATPase subunit MlaF